MFRRLNTVSPSEIGTLSTKMFIDRLLSTFSQYCAPRNFVDTSSDEAAQVGAGKLLAPLSARMLSKLETVNLCQNRGVSASVYNFV